MASIRLAYGGGWPMREAFWIALELDHGPPVERVMRNMGVPSWGVRRPAWRTRPALARDAWIDGCASMTWGGRPDSQSPGLGHPGPAKARRAGSWKLPARDPAAAATKAIAYAGRPSYLPGSSRIRRAHTTITTTLTAKITVAAAFTSGVIPRRRRPQI